MNFYRLLGVSPKAEPQEIKRAFYRKARKFHPDVNPGASTLFKHITQAYKTLIDPVKRGEYERVLSRKGLLEILSERFVEFLGFTDRPKRGTDIVINLKLTLKEAITGSKREVSYRRRVVCERCDGCGFDEESVVRECVSCKGGRMETKFGRFICLHCLGRGFVIEKPCKGCDGSGYIYTIERVLLNIPTGIEEGYTELFKGMGNSGLNGGEYGDLKVKYSIDFGVFGKEGKDLSLKVKLPKPPENYHYLSIKVPTGEKISIKMPQEKPPLKLRLKGHGYPDTTGDRGDLILYIL